MDDYESSIVKQLEVHLRKQASSAPLYIQLVEAIQTEIANGALPEGAHLPSELHFEIKDDMPRPRTLLGAWKEMLDIWKLQKSDPDYQYDTPLPPTAKIERKRKVEMNESSIGDLAPKNLS